MLRSRLLKCVRADRSVRGSSPSRAAAPAEDAHSPRLLGVVAFTPTRNALGAASPGDLLSTELDPLQRDREARLRYSIIGPLLPAPAAPEELSGCSTSITPCARS